MQILTCFLFLGFVATPTLTFAQAQEVAFSSKYPAGSIVIHTEEHALYFLKNSEQAIRYPIAAPKRGKEWEGYAHVAGKFLKPDWSPPEDVRRDHPELPDVIPGGDKRNPMGAAALTLDRDQFAIHGTTNAMRRSIGHNASYGCIRMYNEDISDLFRRVRVGALVVKLP